MFLIVEFVSLNGSVLTKKLKELMIEFEVLTISRYYPLWSVTYRR